jgi:hypothetical protein
MERIVMDQLAKKEDEWLRRATAAAVAEVRKITLGTIAADTPVGRLSDRELGWLAAAVVFAWCSVKVEQAIEEGRDARQAVLETGTFPSPCDVGVVHSILAELADTAQVDWLLPLSAWSKDIMVGFLLVAWRLIAKAKATRDQGKGEFCENQVGIRKVTTSPMSLSSEAAVRADAGALVRSGCGQGVALGSQRAAASARNEMPRRSRRETTVSLDQKLVAAAVKTMSLERIQKLLRSICGTRFRCCDDPIYRQELWRQLDHLVVRGKCHARFQPG